MTAPDTDQIRDAAQAMTGAYRRLLAARLSDDQAHQIRAWDACTLAADALDAAVTRLLVAEVEAHAATEGGTR